MEDNQEITAEANYIENNECNNISTIPRRAKSGKVAKRLEMKFGGKKYGTQFNSTGKKDQEFTHGKH